MNEDLRSCDYNVDYFGGCSAVYPDFTADQGETDSKNEDPEAVWRDS